jgi:hypothetical protein
MTNSRIRDRLVNTLSAAFVLGSAAVGAAGCGDAPATAASSGTETTSAALWDVDENTLVSKEWDSGETSHLSEWKNVSCVSSYGDDYLIGGLTVFHEPSGNWDDFVARLEATCRQFSNVLYDDPVFGTQFGYIYLPTGTEHTDTVFSSDHRTPGVTIALPQQDDYASGMNFYVNNADGYVKDIQLLYVEKLGLLTSLGGLPTYDYDSMYHTDFALGNGGTWIHRECPDQQVISSVSVRYSTNTGKLRNIKFGCRPLTYL